MSKSCLICLYTVLFIGVCIWLKDLLTMVEVPEQMNAPYCKCNAPQTNNASRYNQARVFNGTQLSESKRPPWTVAIYLRNESHFAIFCTGTVVTPRHVVSAAHCFEKFLGKSYISLNTERFNLYAGTGFTKESFRNRENPKNFRNLKSITLYSRYSQTLVYDMSILELTAPFDENLIWPACLYGTENYKEDLLYAGYGSTRIHWKNSSGEYTFIPDPKKEKAILDQEPEHNLKLMMTRLQKTFTIWGFLMGMIEVQSKESSLCFGDSGGGLLMEDAKKLFLVGVVTATHYQVVNNATAVGHLSCTPGSIAVITPIYHYLNWMKAITKEDLCIGIRSVRSVTRLVIFLLVAWVTLFSSIWLIFFFIPKSIKGQNRTAHQFPHHFPPIRTF